MASEKLMVVVIAADNGTASKDAFARALKYFPVATTDFHIAHVRPHIKDVRFDIYESPKFQEHWKHEEERRSHQSKQVLSSWSTLAAKAGLPHYQVVELQGDPRDRLCSYCKEVGAEILVLGDRGVGPLQRMLLGSVASYCVHHAPCGVLINHGNVALPHPAATVHDSAAVHHETVPVAADGQ